MRQFYAPVQFESNSAVHDAPRANFRTPLGKVGTPLWMAACGLLLIAAVSGCQPVATPVAPVTRVAPVAASPQEFTAVDRLLELMKTRLGLMHDIARWKWNQQAAIEDPEREQKLLDRMMEQAREGGVDAELAREFFAAQIEAAKLVQQADFDHWKAENQSTFADVPELARLRQQIDQLNNEMLSELHAVLPALKPDDRAVFDRRVDAVQMECVKAKEVSIGPLRRLMQEPAAK